MSRPAKRSWLRWLFLGLALILVLLVLAIGWFVGTQSGLRTAVSLAHRAAPELLTINSASGRLIGPLSFQGLSLNLPALKGSIDNLDLDFQTSELFTGLVHIDTLKISGVDLELLPTEDPDQAQSAIELPESLAAPMDLEVAVLEIADVRVKNGDTAIELSRLTARASWIDTQIELRSLEAQGAGVQAEASASLNARGDYPLSGRLNFQAQLPNYAGFACELLVSGELRNPVLELQVAPPYNATLDAALSELFTSPSLQASLLIESEALESVSATLPADVRSVLPKLSMTANGPLDNLVASGQLDISGQGVPKAQTNFEVLVRNTGIDISKLVAQVEGQPQPVVVSGGLEFDGQQPVNMRVSWPELSVPVGTNRFRALKGTLALDGTLENYKFSGSTQFDYLGQSNPITLSGSGTQSAAELDALRVGMGSGGLTARASADWSNGLRALVNLQGQNVNPGLYVEELPGALDLRLKLALAQDKEGALSANLSDLKISGELVDLPVKASGRARYAGAELTAQDIVVKLGDNRIALDGTIDGRKDGQSDLEWSIDALDLSQFSQLAGVELAGKVQVEGSLRGAVSNPQIAAELTASEVTANGQKLEGAQFSLEGARREHRYSLEIETPELDLALEGNGDFQGDKVWLYALNNLQINHPDLDASRKDHEWVLRSPAVGALSASTIDAEPLCLQHRAPKDGGAVCLSASQKNGGEFKARVGLESLQLDNLNVLLPESSRLAGTLAGDLSWQGKIEQTTAQLSLEGIALSLKDDEDWKEVLAFSPGSVVVAPGPSLQLDVHLPLADSQEKAGLFADATLTPVAGQPTERWPIDARLSMAFPDLSWLASFTDQLDTFSGALKGELELGGTLEAPKLTGATVFTAPSQTLSELGIELRDTRIELKGTQDGLKLVGNMRSGEGALTLAGDVDWSDGLTLEGTIAGSNFTVSDSPLARAAISPDIRAQFSNNKLKLTGDVAIPLADIRLAKVPAGAVSASRDQRFAEQVESAPPLDIDAEIRVRLGENVSFSGLGLEASFGGELTVSDKSAGTTTGKGEIRIKEGTYKAYGQDLSVENGKVIFAGGPIDEPGLDIRAVRQATPDVSVGVMVQGSLLQPRLEVFSTPSLPQSDQLSYLVLGRSLSSSSASENSLLQQAAMAIGVEGGTLLTDKIGKNLGVDTLGIESAPGTGTAQAALVVGKYLSPRLYVSYGYGLFEPISTLRMEYQLSKLWRVVTQSTNKATGGDILWVKER